MSAMDQLLRRYYAAYRRDHQVQRAKLLAAVENSGIVRQGEFEPVISRPFAFTARRGYRAMIAAAAIIMILFGSIFFFTTGPKSASVDAVWASAVDQAERVQSVHLKVSTYTAGTGASQSVEMWWRRPHDFRMEFAHNDLILTGNSLQRCRYTTSDRHLTINKAGAPGLEMAILGEFGDLFGSKQSLTQGWVRNSTLIHKEKINYKGEQCYKLTFEKGARCYECVVNEKGSLIYEAKMYDRSNPPVILQKIEILSIDTEMPDSLFVITPQPDDHVKNNMDAVLHK
jgi:outer membrane lipoprotein-sorting protein